MNKTDTLIEEILKEFEEEVYLEGIFDTQTGKRLIEIFHKSIYRVADAVATQRDETKVEIENCKCACHMQVNRDDQVTCIVIEQDRCRHCHTGWAFQAGKDKS